MDTLNRETVEALLALEANEFRDDVAALENKLAGYEDWDATLDARREGEREALRGMREWCENPLTELESKADFSLLIAEIDRRLAEGETK